MTRDEALLPATFWMRVSVGHDAGCWLWEGRREKGGYPIACDGSRSVLAHRMAYRAFRGEIPAGLQLDHLCRTRHCVNPEHLEAVTARENVLRSTGLAAVNAQKTECPYGHALAAVGQRRVCLVCRRKRDAERRTRNFAAGLCRCGASRDGKPYCGRCTDRRAASAHARYLRRIGREMS